MLISIHLQHNINILFLIKASIKLKIYKKIFQEAVDIKLHC